jgi:hypothetical protein
MSDANDRPDPVRIGFEASSQTCVGVFYWSFKRPYIDKVPLNKSTGDGAGVSHGDHPALWKIVDAATRKLVGDSYSALPRGRVVFHPISGRFSLFADRCVPPDWIKEIARQFGLPEGCYDLRRDPHYRCQRCLRDFVSDDIFLGEDEPGLPPLP